MGVPKRLTEMQKRFAEFIIFGGVDGPVTQGEAAKLAGKVRNKLGVELELIANDVFEFCWVTDFPFYELNDKVKVMWGNQYKNISRSAEGSQSSQRLIGTRFSSI